MKLELPVALTPISTWQQNDNQWAAEHPLGTAQPFSNDQELFDAFRKWGLPDEGKKYVLLSRMNSPTRRPTSYHGGNVRTYYYSRKMGREIATESKNVEFPAVVRYDFDGVTYEFYCQPTQVSIPTIITRKDKDGTISQYSQLVLYTADILRLTKFGVFVEEWKTEQNLEELASKYPNRFVKLQGTWHCREREEYFAKLGITYCVRSSEDHPCLFCSNLQRLSAYLKPASRSLSDDAFNAIRRVVEEVGAISLARLNEHAYEHDLPWKDDVILPTPPGQFTVDDVVKAIADQRLFVDLDNDDLTNPSTAIVCSSAKQLELIKWRRAPPHPVTTYYEMEVAIGTEFHFRGQTKAFVVTACPVGKVLYRDSAAKIFDEISDLAFQKYLYQGDIKLLSSPKTTDELLAACDYINDRKVDDAHRHFELVMSVEQARAGECAPPQYACHIRTIQRYREKMHKAGESRPLQMLALVPAARPGRGAQISKSTLSLIEEVIRRGNNPANPLVSRQFREFKDLAMERDVPACSKPTFYKRAAEFRDVIAREGRRRAYAKEPAVWYLYRSDKVHGGWPFHRVHADHTKLDIVIKVRGFGGRTYRLRPWLTVLIDETTREVLAFYLASHPPSAVSCMMAIRSMVALHHRVPDFFVLDNGSEFRSHALRRLCRLNNINVDYRPAHEARFGAVMERLFDTTNTELIHNLVGNTKALRYVRTLTKSVDPIHADHLTFVELHGLLEYFFFQEYNRESIHPAHDHKPEEYAERLFREMGRRLERLRPYDMTFMLQTLIPVSKGGTREIDPRMGVTVGGIWYWTPEFAERRNANKKVEVYVDMWDICVAYALINGKWCRCVSSLLLQFRALTRLELRYAFYTVRLRLKSAPSANFEAVLAEVLGESLPPVAEATACSREFYKPYGLASISDRPMVDDGVLMAGVEDALEDDLKRLEVPRSVHDASNGHEERREGSGEQDRPRKFAEVDFKNLPTRNPL
ncbi:integrase catalytic domain-containing protein [Paraburkholderia phenoliruptrix]|uniref:integrase catalytic domain-containing protein n=1 Tax=Paraburkholderia phenoliruptrix TaxID=252970 RepID=UPI002869CDBA|nr:transposase family protein [Paraburkholderia phenoliruptrix]WMY11753.1 transposase family protein [Paraburkholderia phenoliruptrix]